MDTLTNLLTKIPADIDIISMMKFIGVFAFVILFLGLLGRVVLGRRSSMNHAISSAIGILFVYAATIVIYTFDPYALRKFLAPLPFVTFSGDVLHIFSFTGASFTVICRELVNVILLAFLVNLLDSWIPKGKKFGTWFGYRIVTVALAMALHYLTKWVFNTFLPGVLVTYAPTILLCILGAMLALGLANVVLSLVLTAVNPIIGALYTFFFSSFLGKQISKAVLTTVIVCGVVFALNYFGYAAISISAGVLGNYIPLLAVCIILWYLLGYML